MKRLNSNRGLTLVEALIGLFIFVSIFLPLFRFAGPTANSSKVKDLKIACAILRGECEIMYKNHETPPKKRKVVIDKSTYDVEFDSKRDSMIVDWTLRVKRAGKQIAGLHGFLYEPMSGK
jgi:hypothetical protein